MNKLRPGTLIPAVFFSVLFLTGLLIYRDYGTFIDEGLEMYTGIVNTKAVLEKLSPELPEKVLGPVAASIPPLASHGDRYYGVLMQFPLQVIDRITGLFSSEKKDIWETRHFFVFLFYFLAVLAFYFSVRRVFGSWSVALGAAMLLVLFPRFFAESFYNIKDMAAFSAFTLAFWTLILFLENGKTRWLILTAVLSALASAIRLTVGLPVFILLAVFPILLLKKKLTLPQLAAFVPTALGSFAVCLILFYPASWSDPLSFFPQALEYMAHHPWNGLVLFSGTVYHVSNLPWNYLPTWMLITVPLTTSALALVGLISGATRRNWSFTRRVVWWISLLLPGLVILATIILKPTLYDGWRHFYFLFHPLLLLAAFGIQEIAQLCGSLAGRWTKPLLAGLFLLSQFPQVLYIVQAHPYQNVYFNELVGDKEFQGYEKDYWGLAYRKALQEILRRDPRERIPILKSLTSSQASEMLPQKDRSRIAFVEQADQARYVIRDFRAEPAPVREGETFFSIYAAGRKIFTVEKTGP